MRTQKQIEAVIKDLARMASNSKDKNLKVMLSLGISYLKWVLGEDSIKSFSEIERDPVAWNKWIQDALKQ